MGVRSEMLKLLGSDLRMLLFVALIRELAMRGRGRYVEAGTTTALMADGLRCVNELVLAIIQHVEHSGLDGTCYPDHVFVQILEERAATGHFADDFRIAVQNATDRAIHFGRYSEGIAVFTAEFREIFPSFRRWPEMYVQDPSFRAVAAFVDGYRWGAKDAGLTEFGNWMRGRHPERSELAWSWLVLCELYPPDDLPSPRRLTEDQDAEAVACLFDLLDEFYQTAGSDVLPKDC